jgi:hypothetical protein
MHDEGNATIAARAREIQEALADLVPPLVHVVEMLDQLREQDRAHLARVAARLLGPGGATA